MLYYIVMSDLANDSKKPIDEVRDDVKSLVTDIKCVKSDIKYIKEYIRKLEIRKQIEEQEDERQENEYVKPSNSWFW